MADAVTARVVCDTKGHYTIHLTNISDGTGESAVVKIDKSALLAPDGAEPASLDFEEIQWNVQGFASVRLLWDHTTDDVAMTLGGSGYVDFTNFVDRDDTGVFPVLADPRSSGGTGDVLLTTNGAVSGATYDITLRVKKQSN